MGEIEIVGPLKNGETRFETWPKDRARWADIHWTATVGTITDEGVYKLSDSPTTAKSTTIAAVIGHVRTTFPHYLGTIVATKVVSFDNLSSGAKVPDDLERLLGQGWPRWWL